MPTPKQYATPAERQRAYRQRTAVARQQQLQAKGLPALPTIASLPGEPRWRALHQQAALALTTQQTEMQAYYDARSDTWQESERGDLFLARLEALENLLSELEACL